MAGYKIAHHSQPYTVPRFALITPNMEPQYRFRIAEAGAVILDANAQLPGFSPHSHFYLGTRPLCGVVQ